MFKWFRYMERMVEKMESERGVDKKGGGLKELEETFDQRDS